MEAVCVRFYRMDANAKLPERAYETDACWDIFANAEMIVQGNSKILVPTGLKVGLMPGWELQVRPRSGLAAKFGLSVLNTPGTIDAGYRGEIKVILFNTSGKPFMFYRGHKIAQLALKPVHEMKMVEVESEDLLGDSARGKGGFGSTGTE